MSHDCHKTFRADWFQTDSPIKPTPLCTDPRLFQYNAYQVSTINLKLHLKTNPTQKTVGTPMLKKKESNWTTVLTPLALQRFPSHMNSLLQTLGW